MREDFDQDLSHEIWDTNYKGPHDKTVVDTRNRQAKAAASVEKEEIRDQVEAEFKWLLENGRGSGGGRITANLGVEERVGTTLMNCFVMDPVAEHENGLDAMEGIYNQITKAAKTLKSEGGYGHNFSWLRPNGMYIDGIGSRTPGVIPFMGMWNETSRVITMGSESIIGKLRKDEKKKVRKGAMMGVLDCFSKNTEILTDKGWVLVDEVATNTESYKCIGEDGNEYQTRNGFEKPASDIYEIEVEDGSTLQITEDHKLEVKNIKTGDIYLKALKDINPEIELIKTIDAKL